ncbi:hypothetical protein BGZ98_004356 [Dissophora globulifera]|nr:hypothetical protein BGZ98_004356 [Dissophora globulifera]
MHIPPQYTGESRRTAIMFIGNTGVGKSTLLNQLGGNFEAGVSFRQGLTDKVSEQTVFLNGEWVVLMNVPGLFEPDDKRTKENAAKLTEALKRGYNYKLYFVLMAHPRGPTDEEMVMMSRVNSSVRQLNGAQVSFRVIVNQITSDKVYDMYDRYVAQDNFRQLFSDLKIPEFSFDITIDNVTLLMFNEDALEKKLFAEILTEEVQQHKEVSIKLPQGFKVENEDLKMYQKALLGLASRASLVGRDGCFTRPVRVRIADSGISFPRINAYA